MSEGIVIQRDPLLHRGDITAVLPPTRGGEQCARLLALNRQHDHDDDRGKHHQDQQIHCSQLIVGSGRMEVAGRASFGVGSVTVERGGQLRVSGIEIALSQRVGLSDLS